MSIFNKIKNFDPDFATWILCCGGFILGLICLYFITPSSVYDLRCHNIKYSLDNSQNEIISVNGQKLMMVYIYCPDFKVKTHLTQRNTLKFFEKYLMFVDLKTGQEIRTSCPYFVEEVICKKTEIPKKANDINQLIFEIGDGNPAKNK